MFKKSFHSTYLQIPAVLSLLFILGAVFAEPGSTNAFYSDTETSIENIFEAVGLDFLLDTPTASYVGLTPNNSTPVFPVTVSTSTDSLPFAYSVSSATPTGNSAFCDLLTLMVAFEGSSIYTGSIAGFATSTLLFPDGGDNWEFSASLASAASTFSNQNCTFNVLYDGWQIGFASGQAYHDTESVTFSITSGSWEDDAENEAGFEGVAAIMDADVSEQEPTDTNGSASSLNITRQSGKDSEAFIGFDYALPPGSEIVSASLKAYLFTTPSANTNYRASRADGAWTEGGITWNTKPAVSVTDTISTGDTSAKWLTWDVTSDVEDYVEDGGTNYGWNIADIDALPVGSRSGQLRSSEQSSQEEVRPVLEVSFEAPIATTNHLVINEVFFHVDGGHGGADEEWIEIYNPTNSAVDISGWDICDNTSCDTFPALTPTIPAKGFAVVVNNASTFSQWTIPGSAVQIALNVELGNGFSNTGDRVILQNAADTIIDQVSYGADTSVFNPSVAITGEDGKSIARMVKGWDTDTEGDWMLNATPNPGTNPGSDGVEIMRFTAAGVEIAPLEKGLAELPELSASDIAELVAENPIVDETIVEPAPPVAEVAGATTQGSEVDTEEVLVPNSPLALPELEEEEATELEPDEEIAETETDFDDVPPAREEDVEAETSESSEPEESEPEPEPEPEQSTESNDVTE